jgi:two-component system phosphate regulon response regulator PhoB
MVKKVQPLIVIAEDHDAVAVIIKYYLSRSGYNLKVASNGLEAWELIQKYKPDLIISDWAMPDLNGIEICKRVREHPELRNTPIIMTSAKSDDSKKVLALDSGADDYMAKPVSPEELMARIRAVLRRIRPAFASQILEYKDIKMDLEKCRVTRGRNKVDLSPIEFQILQMLMEVPGRVLSRDDLISKIWGINYSVGVRTIDVHVTRLRKALMKASNEMKPHDVIKTVRLTGYTLQS